MKTAISGDREKQCINQIFGSLTKLINDPSCSSFGRDNSIDLCLKYVDVANGCAWTMRFIEQGSTDRSLQPHETLSNRFVSKGLPKLLDVGSCVEGLPNNLQITEHTKMHVACCLSIVNDDLYSDKHKDDYRAICDTHIRFVKKFRSSMSQRFIGFLTIFK